MPRGHRHLLGGRSDAERPGRRRRRDPPRQRRAAGGRRRLRREPRPAALFKTAPQAVVSGGDFGDQTVAQPSAANPICALIFAPGTWTVQGQTGRTAFLTVALGGRAWSMAG